MALNGKIAKAQSLTGNLVKSSGSGGDPNPVITRGSGANSIMSVNSSEPNVASGDSAIAIGVGNQATAKGAIALGALSLATAQNAIAIGNKIENKPANQATNLGAIAIGSSTQATGLYAVSVGNQTIASGGAAFAAGNFTEASGTFGVATGYATEAKARYSAAFGNSTDATGGASFVIGAFNEPDANAVDATHGQESRKYIFIVGNGTDDSNRSNAMTVDWDGNAVIAGKATVGAAPTADMDVATKKYVDDNGGSVTVDTTLSTTSENPVQNKAITAALATKADQAGIQQVIEDEVDDWLSVQAPSIGTLSNAAKRALLNCFAHVAWIDDQGQSYYNALESELFPDATLDSITAVFTQGSATILDTDSLETLRQYLVVTANFSDSTTEIVTSYTLSGTLTAGTSIITVSYSGKTDTFNVTVTLDRVGRFGTFTDGYTAVKVTTSSQYPSYVPFCFRQQTAARSTTLTPVQNRNYVLTVTDSSKYNIAAYDVASLNELEIPKVTQATPSVGYSSGAKTIVWATSDSVSTPYIWIALKKMDNTAFTAAELANAAEAVFTFTESA